MPVSLHFVHGWGCDASLWDALSPLLADWAQTRGDLGYFGGRDAVPDGRCLVVAHSHGALRMLLDPPPGCVGMVAINGFDRFGQARVLDRMIDRLAVVPAGVLDAFRARIGLPPAPAIADPARLAGDLAHMRDGHADAADWPHPLVALHGGADPIVPAEVRDAAFAAAPQLHAETLTGGSHLLPLSDPEWCAEHVRAAAERLG